MSSRIISVFEIGEKGKLCFGETRQGESQRGSREWLGTGFVTEKENSNSAAGDYRTGSQIWLSVRLESGATEERRLRIKRFEEPLKT